MTNKYDWTHENVTIKDVRKLSKLYAIYVDIDGIDRPLFVNNKIFEERMASYFLTTNFSRNDVLSVKWNLYITQGYFVKMKNSELEKHPQDDDSKYFVSFLEIAGKLGTFQSIQSEKN